MSFINSLTPAFWPGADGLSEVAFFEAVGFRLENRCHVEVSTQMMGVTNRPASNWKRRWKWFEVGWFFSGPVFLSCLFTCCCCSSCSCCRCCCSSSFSFSSSSSSSCSCSCSCPCLLVGVVVLLLCSSELASCEFYPDFWSHLGVWSNPSNISRFVKCNRWCNAKDLSEWVECDVHMFYFLRGNSKNRRLHPSWKLLSKSLGIHTICCPLFAAVSSDLLNFCVVRSKTPLNANSSNNRKRFYILFISIYLIISWNV